MDHQHFVEKDLPPRGKLVRQAFIQLDGMSTRTWPRVVVLPYAL